MNQQPHKCNGTVIVTYTLKISDVSAGPGTHTSAQTSDVIDTRKLQSASF